MEQLDETIKKLQESFSKKDLESNNWDIKKAVKFYALKALEKLAN